MAAKELLNIPIAERAERDDAPTSSSAALQPASRHCGPNFTDRGGAGSFPTGKGECIVSQTMSARFKGAQVGGMLDFGPKEKYHVVGIFTAGGSSAESEVWADLEGRGEEYRARRLGLVRAAPRGGARRTQQADRNDRRRRPLQTGGDPRSDILPDPEQLEHLLERSGTLIAVLLTFGAMFAAANTMFAAVSTRTREIGTMRALGFSQFDVLISFLGESLLLCALGGSRRIAGDAAAQCPDL